MFGEFCEGAGNFWRDFFHFSEEFLRNYGSFWGESGDFPGVLGIFFIWRRFWRESWIFWKNLNFWRYFFSVPVAKVGIFCQEFEVSVIFFLEPGAKVGFFGGNLNFCNGFWYLFDVLQIVLGDFLNFWRYFFRCLVRKLEYWGKIWSLKESFFWKLELKVGIFCRNLNFWGWSFIFLGAFDYFLLFNVAFNGKYSF